MVRRAYGFGHDSKVLEIAEISPSSFVRPHNAWVTMRNELHTITSTLDDLSKRITHLVETAGPDVAGDIYTELVAAERTVGTLMRRLNRVATRLG